MPKSNIFLKLITLTDFIGHEPTLKLGGAPRNRTIFGGILCVAIYCFFILAALYFGQELVYRDIPTVIETTTPISPSDEILLDHNNFRFFLGMRRLDTNASLNITKILNISINFLHYENSSLSLHPIPTKICEEADFDIQSTSYKSIDNSFKLQHSLRNLLCIDLKGSRNFSIQSHKMFEKHSKIEIIATRNANVDTNSPDIMNSVIEVKIVDTEFNMREFEKIGTLTLVNHDFALDQMRPKIIQMFLRLITFKTDIGYMFEDFKSRTFHKVDHIETLRMSNPNVFNLITINISLSNRKFVNYRKYYKFQNWVAELGGIVRALTLLAFVFNYYNDKSTYYEQMINSLFDVDDIIKYYQYSIGDILTKGKRKARDSVVLCSVKKEKNYFEKEYQQLYNNSELNINNYIGVPPFMKKCSQMRKTSSNDQKVVSNQVTGLNNQNKGSGLGINTSIPHKEGNTAGNKKSESGTESIADPHECYIDSLKKSKQIKDHYDKVKKTRFHLSQIEVFCFCFCNKKDNPKYNSYMGGKELINERADIMYILRQNLQFDRLKNLLLRDYQILLLNSLTKFMLDPERVNLSDFTKCQYEKFIDAYDHATCGNNIVDMKLSKWVETKYKFEK